LIDIRRRTTYFFLLVSLGHVLLISAQVQSRSADAAGRFRPVIVSVAFGAFAGVQRFTAGIADGASSIWSRYAALRGVVAENAQLKNEIATLQGQLQEQRAIAAQTRSLESLLKLQQSITPRTVAARVIAGDPAPGALMITIDRGSADGVAADQAVIGQYGVVGRVIGRPLPHASQVQLLIGRAAGAGAVIERTQAGGNVIGGAGDPPLNMIHVQNIKDVQVGDRVVTSGIDGIFPSGYLIGKVEKIERGSGEYKLIAIRPAVDFSYIDVVLVMLDRPAFAGGGS
jgi:rod shape-determining protein MreC